MKQKEDKTWHQFLALADCKDCDNANGFVWTKPNEDGKLVVIAIEPCTKHRRMLDSQGWEILKE